jgi:DNA mismatch endonuclease, patch repair protein
MMDTLTGKQRSERMALIRGKNTGPELVVRRLVHGMGFRYRLHVRSLPGRPDLVLRSLKKVIFVHGCFWHRHGDPSCKLARLPKSRLEFWQVKLESNRQRDLKTLESLNELGWEVLEVWECQLHHLDFLQDCLRSFLKR